MPKSNLAVRLLTAGIAAPLLLLIMFKGPPVAFGVVVILASLLGSREVLQMTHPADAVAQWIGVASSVAVTATIALAGDDPRLVIAVLVALPLFGMLMPLVRLGEIPTAGMRIMAGGAVPIYVGATLGMLGRLRAASDDGAGWVLLVLMLGWFGDTGGYFFGRFLGKTKLYEAVSPKKTRAGLVGAVVGALAGAVLAAEWYLPRLPVTDALLLGGVSGLLGQAGDLTESLLKRSTGVKDSGSLLPGHGGILDRIDAVLVLAPLVYLYTVFRFGRLG
ncbi:MAG TPA: phosphatidate cytidylyltransferase [Polyangiaceae bacterium]|nr:phosphatidate cytidylyltransferase [Polyangiaceae bacterium]